MRQIPSARRRGRCMMPAMEPSLPKSIDVAIVGAGPAGLAGAIAAAEAGRRVLLLDRLDRVGRKLLATGGGRCNLTRRAEPEQIMAAFGRQGRFMTPALRAMAPAALCEWFDRLGLATVAEDDGAVYPVTRKAADVRNVLLARCEQLGVTIATRCTARRLIIDGGAIAGLETDRGPAEAGRVILACGGKGYAELGGTGLGYDLAGQAGHEIITPTPALAPLVTEQAWPGRCAGVSLPDARVWIDLAGQDRKGVRGPVLLTHRGLSGPAVLDLSGQVGRLLLDYEHVPIRLALTPDTPAEAWRKTFDRWRKTDGSRPIQSLLAGAAPASLAETLLNEAGAETRGKAAELPAGARDRLAESLAGAPLTVVATEGFDKAMVTRGGVSLKEVRPDTLESKRVAGLHLAGELLDLDGPCGGYNLTWAFVGGRLAGASAGQSA